MWSAVTPFNFLRYNSNPQNLALHGIHPRYTHATQNMAMLFGVLYLLLLQRYAKRMLSRDNSTQSRSSVLSWATIGCGLAVLSIAPHQEPRFMLPLLTPLLLLGAEQLYRSNSLWLAWLTTNALLVALFGGLHQSGLTPALLHLSAKASSTASADVVTFHTYMPPRSLLAAPVISPLRPCASGGIGDRSSLCLYDAGGGPAADLRASLLTVLNHRMAHNRTSAPLVILAPATVEPTLQEVV
jgi:phosphatidylinositol glycan class Z